MTRVCLDTSAYGHFKRGAPDVVALVTQARDVCIPVIVLGELRAGFRLGDRAERNEAELRSFLTNPAVRVLDVDDEAASLYGELMAQLKRDGRPLPSNDIWIAALAAREGATVLTYDAHFEGIRRIGVRLLA